MILPRVSAVLANILIPRVAERRPPDYVVGANSPEGAYLYRWWLTPWRRWQQQLGERARANPTVWNRLAERIARLLPNLYIHQFLRDDDDRALHDHPSCAISLILRGGYIEHTIAEDGTHRRTLHAPGSLRYLPATRAHRIELPVRTAVRQHADGSSSVVDVPLPCWTLFWFGPTVREWGFHCPGRGWVRWREFTAAGQPGEIGPGCDA